MKNNNTQPARNNFGSWHVMLDILLLLFMGSLSSNAFGQGIEELVADLFGRSCARAGCHAGPIPQMDLNLDRDHFYADLVDEASSERPELKRVAPGQPDSSYLMMKIKGTSDIKGVQMPLIGDKLDAEEVLLIENWIAGMEGIDEARKLEAPVQTPLAFNSWKAINLPTTRPLEAGNILFLIAHRFNPKLSDGYDALYGLDGSGIIYLHLGYAFTDRFLVALARSNASDNVELQARYNLMQQDASGKHPIGISLVATGNWISEETPGQSKYRPEAYKFTGQVSFTCSISDIGGLAFVPGILINAADNVDNEPAQITLGVAGRWRFYRNFALVGEWAPVVSGFTRTITFGNDIRFDTWGTGLEIGTGGHVFQILFSNSVGLTTDQYLRGGDLDIRKGDMRLGFNIYRILN